MRFYFFTLLVSFLLLLNQAFPAATNHTLDVFWGTRINHFVLFNQVRYFSPEFSAEIPLSVEADIRMDETFYFFTFSAYSLSASVHYRVLEVNEWSIRINAGYFLSMMPFYTWNSNWIYSAPTAGFDGGWKSGALALEWQNRLRFYIDGLDMITGLSCSWRFHPRFHLIVSAGLIAAVLYDFSRTETAVDAKIGAGFVF